MTVSWSSCCISNRAKRVILDIIIDTLLTLPRLKHVSATKDDVINATKESIRLQVIDHQDVEDMSN